MQTVCLMLLLLAVVALAKSDFEALLELKKGIEKDPTDQVLVSWDSKALASDNCPQNWYGVVCIKGHVASITLNDLGLAGNFSFPVLAGLSMLRNLSISNNKLMGTISNVGSIESLDYLDISSNLFHGLVPSAIVNLKNLVFLNLSTNNFHGTVPPVLANLEKLKYLDLRGNGFSGDVMSLLSQLGNVVHVDLSSNQFSGSLDLALGNSTFVSTIQYLNISYNSLAGELFAHDGMPYFDSLEVFDASNNQLVGTVPPFTFVVSLRVLRLGSNQFSGSLPEALLQESSMVLSELDLSLNQIEGPVGSITSTTLKKLNISSNKLSGLLPTTIGHCAIIDLSNNMLSGNLSRIQYWGNYVVVIQLSSNTLTGALPNQTSQFLRLTSLNVSNNSLNGDIPSVLGTYPELQVIDLSFNSLTGFLLPSLFASAALTDLKLAANNFTGPIPFQEVQSSIQNFSLVSLDLSHNSLDGYLPPEISKLHNLVYLNLSYNRLNGSIPINLPEGLKGLDLSSNNLSGVVPNNLRRFPDSSFHPGNFLLEFSDSLSSPNGAPDPTLRKSHSPVKPAIKFSLIVGIVGTAAMIALLSLLIFHRRYWHKTGRRNLKRNGRNEGLTDVESSVSRTSAINKNLDESLSSISIHQSLHSSRMGTADDLSKHKDCLDPIRKGEGVSSPMSLLSSSNPSPSKTQISSDPHGMLKVHSPDKLAGDLHLFDSSLVFTAEELSNAPAEIIGRSCHGALYKATLDSGKALAIKCLREGIAKGRKEFAREIKKLGTVRHPNLVSLDGYYWGPKDHEKMLISNYIDAKCLTFYLQEIEPRKVPPLSLHERLRVAVNVARCLNYLHNERAIPHGNLKSTNILLETPNMNALLTDYSLHRILTSDGTAEQVLDAGALGYRPPEFASSSKPCPSLKSDVYAFGVLLLELLTGRCSRDTGSRDPGVLDLTDWVRLLAEQNRTRDCLDKSLGDKMDGEASRILDAILQVALRCILPPSERPDMKSVLEDLLVL
ncbi:hypothetical protein K2173_008369 [Erythroxylum novogranatense]|uniref:Protein kinase domain-containing protein n=1 Tax=Erythroxylum novogranatense TaxID=1862640 RepID=A0AAV8TLB1_9ROSI|nr:hypothetical protein K2173_008369 [Erythroxylum novogranatense]